MRNLLVSLAAVVLVAVSASVAHAFASEITVNGVIHKVNGPVISVNPGNKTIEVKNADDDKSYTVGVVSGDFATVKAGDMVQVTMWQGSNLTHTLVK